MERKIPQSPGTVTAAVTGRCNLSCRYCFYADEMAALKDLPTQQWLDFFVEAGKAGVMKITLSGGEPFARQDILELIESIVQNRMRFSILTNGTLISDKLAGALAGRRQRCDYIQVSVDGSGPATHDLIRGPGSFEKMMRGIELLKTHHF